MSELAKKIIEDLWIKNRNFCSTDYDNCLDYFQKILPFHIHEYRCEGHDQGWAIPPKFDIVKATISYNGQKIFSAKSPLEVIGLSAPFNDTIPLTELKKHLHFDKRYPDAVPYHFRQNYRPWDRTWGFCVTQEFFDLLQEGDYHVEIETKESPGYLRVAELIKKGKHPQGFAFVAHLDHAGMANDDLAGVAVGVELFKRIFEKETKFTYRLVLVQEIIGSFFYLKYHRDPTVIESCFLEMLGSDTPLALQASQNGKSHLEQTIGRALAEKNIHHRKGNFREIICNDEVMWESMGIPMASLSRFPYPQYHSDKDNPTIISDQAIEESIAVLADSIERLESSSLICKHFIGVTGLSHPDYGLYVDPGQPAFNIYADANQQKLRQIMDLMPLIPHHIFAEQLATNVNLPVDEIINYLKRWESKQLITIV